MGRYMKIYGKGIETFLKSIHGTELKRYINQKIFTVH